NNGRSVIQPLFTSPAQGSNDFGGYDNPTANKLIDQALTAKTAAQAAKFWQQANAFLMKDVANVPINQQKWPLFHSSRVQNCPFFLVPLGCDPTNVWLQGPNAGGPPGAGPPGGRVGERGAAPRRARPAGLVRHGGRGRAGRARRVVLGRARAHARHRR